MRRILFAVAVGLFAVTSPASADGPFIRWARIQGVTQDAVGMEIAGIPTSSRGVTVGSGSAMLNLKNGFLSFEVTGISYDRHYPATGRPIGTYPSGSRMVTIVCDSTGYFGPTEVADSPAFPEVDGNATYRGFISVPQGCRDRPDQIVLLLRHPIGPGTLSGVFLAYGAARSIQ